MEQKPNRHEPTPEINPRDLAIAALGVAAIGGAFLGKAVGLTEAEVSPEDPSVTMCVYIAIIGITGAYYMMKNAYKKFQNIR